MTNLSEGGMAVRTVQALRHSSIIDFAFDLSSRAGVSGKGQVAGINTEGMAGIGNRPADFRREWARAS